MLGSLVGRITLLSLRFRWATVILAAVVLAAGMMAAPDLKLELLPRIDYPQTVVMAKWSEANSVEQFLAEVTLPLEETLSEIRGVAHVESTTGADFTTIIVRNEPVLNQSQMLPKIETAVAATELPADMELPQALSYSQVKMPVMVVSVSSSELSTAELKSLIEKDLQPRLQAVEQIDRVVVRGGQELPAADVLGVTSEENETEATAAAPTAQPGRLPQLVIEGARSLGVDIEYAKDVTPDVLMGLEGTAEQLMTVLNLIPPQTLLCAPGETLALLPAEYVENLDPALQAELELLAADYGGIGRFNLEQLMAIQAGADPASLASEPAAEESPVTTAEIPRVKAVALPESWTKTGAAIGLALETTADVSSEVMEGLLASDPQLLAELQSETWRALAPEAVELALPTVADNLDPTLLAQLEAQRLAAAGIAPTPVPLPESWVTAARGVGVTLATTADVPAEAVGQLSAFAPALMDELSDEILLALAPEVIAALPEVLTSSLDAGMQQTLNNIVIYWKRRQVETGVISAQAPALPTVPLPVSWITETAAMGQTISTTADIVPETMAAIVNSAPERLADLSPEMWRVMPPSAAAVALENAPDGLDPTLLLELEAIQRASRGEKTALPLPKSWITAAAGFGFTVNTTADVPGQAISVLADLAPHLLADLTPEMMLAFTPDVLAKLPKEYLADQDAGLQQTIEIILILEQQANASAETTEAAGEDLGVDLPAVEYGVMAGPAQTVVEAEREVAEPTDIVTTQTDAFMPQASITRMDGKPSLLVQLYKDEDGNTVEVVQRLLHALAAFADENPDVDTDLVFEGASLIEEATPGVVQEVVLGAILCVLAILIILSGYVGGRYRFNWRATLVAGTSVPLSVFAAILLMHWIPLVMGTWLERLVDPTEGGILSSITRLFSAKISLNIVTLSGMAVAVGRVVTDSVAVLENYYRLMQQGQVRREAVIGATGEAAVNIVTTTAMTAAVFLPLGLTGGILGPMFLPFGLTMTYTLAASLVVSITLTPVLISLLIGRKQIPEERETVMQRWYLFALRWVLNHRSYAMIVAVLIFFASLFLLRQLPKGFLPEVGETMINLTIDLPAGTLMAATNDQVLEMEAVLRPLEQIEQVLTEVGGGRDKFLFGGVSQNQAIMMISVRDPEDIEELADEIQAEADAIFGSGRVQVSTTTQTDFSGFSIIVTGDSLGELRGLVSQVKRGLESIDLDGDGVGDIGNVSSSLNDRDNDPGEGGRMFRFDGRPASKFAGKLNTQNKLGVIAAAEQTILESGLPADVRVTGGFETEQQVNGFQDMLRGISFSVLIVGTILVFAFRGMIPVLTILFGLPFALSSAVIALYITRGVLGVPAMVGLMTLAGVGVLNGIVLMRSVQQVRRQGRTGQQILMESSCTWLRSILIATCTSVLSLVPLSISQDTAAVIASNLALVVVAGLLMSALLTLFVGPAVFTFLSDLDVRNQHLT